ncbi:hypothetical protein IC582_021517 [Cucumis melo]
MFEQVNLLFVSGGSRSLHPWKTIWFFQSKAYNWCPKLVREF